MKMNEILDTVRTLACSQGFYRRLLEQIMEIKQFNTEAYERVTEELENQNFKDSLDLVLFFEC